MNTVTANELKTKGISVLEARLKVEEAVIISVRILHGSRDLPKHFQ